MLALRILIAGFVREFETQLNSIERLWILGYLQTLPERGPGQPAPGAPV